MRRTVVWMERAQDQVTVAVGAVLLVLAVILLIGGVWDFVTKSCVRTGHSISCSLASQSVNLLDQVLFALILVEIVHTVVLSLRAHRLVTQPFIAVGLIAVVRRILLLLSDHGTVSVPLLAALIAGVVAFVVALIAVIKFEKPAD